MNDNLRFPIGVFETPDAISSNQIEKWINTIAAFPENLRKSIENLNDEQLDTIYRPDGWTVRQVVHHCADSHMNSLIRFKLSLTENNPTIKPYFEDRWAELIDSKQCPIEPSLKILDGLHYRWTLLLQSLSPDDLIKIFTHPEHGKTFSLAENIGIYAWHCEHHLAHITTLKTRMKWS
ncbi:MAG: bacillithiol transferase BstA [Chitinophagales bacterium]